MLAEADMKTTVLNLIRDRFFEKRSITVEATTPISRRTDTAKQLGVDPQLTDEVMKAITVLKQEEVIREVVKRDTQSDAHYGRPIFQAGDTVRYELQLTNPIVLLELLQRSGEISLTYTGVVSYEGWERPLAAALGCPTADALLLHDVVETLERNGLVTMQRMLVTPLEGEPDESVTGSKSKRYGVKYTMTITPTEQTAT